MSRAWVASASLVILLVALGAGDYFFKERLNPQVAAQGGSVSSARRVVKKGASTKKKDGPDLQDALAQQGFSSEASNEESLIQQSDPSVEVQKLVLLKDNDRVAFLGWIDTPDVKSVFARLKQALQSRFSPNLRELIDEAVQPEDAPARDTLSFTDPAISEEKTVFVRIRTRLYEFHIKAGNEDSIAALIGLLTQ